MNEKRVDYQKTLRANHKDIWNTMLEDIKYKQAYERLEAAKNKMNAFKSEVDFSRNNISANKIFTYYQSYREWQKLSLGFDKWTINRINSYVEKSPNSGLEKIDTNEWLSITQKSTEIEKRMNNWFKEWNIYKSYISNVNNTSHVDALFHLSIDAQLEIKQLSKPVSQQEMVDLNKILQEQKITIKNLLRLPIDTDFESASFNWETPWEIKKSEDMLLDIYPELNTKKGWDSFVTAHGREIYSKLKNYQSKFLVDNNKLLIPRAREIDATLLNIPRKKVIEELKKMGLHGFQKNYMDVIESNFNETVNRINFKPTKHLSDFSFYQNNCSCAVARSLDNLYEGNRFFKKGDMIMAPGIVERRAKEFSKKHFDKDYYLKSIDNRTKGIYAASIVAMVSTVSLLSMEYIPTIKEKLSLTQDTLEKEQCLINATENFQEQFSDSLEGILGAHRLKEAALNMY